MNQNAPQWVTDMDNQLRRGKHVILYGNVDDEYYLQQSSQSASSQLVSLSQLLDRYFSDCGYDLLLHYDVVDGLRVSEPSMLPIFHQLSSRSDPQTPSSPPSRERSFDESFVSNATSTESGDLSGGQNSHLAPSEERPSAGVSLRKNGVARNVCISPSEERPSAGVNLSGAQAVGQTLDSRFRPGPTKLDHTTSSFERTNPVISPTGNSSTSISGRKQANVAISDIRKQILSQKEVSTAVVFAYSDKIFTDAQRQDPNERELLVTLKKMLSESVEPSKSSLQGRRNPMVIVASQLGSIPTWFYQDHPLLSLVQIPKPKKEERERYITKIYPIITDNQSLSEQIKKEIIDAFAELTNDLTILDLRAIGKMCEAENITISQPKDLKNLVSRYRYGIQEDPWEVFDIQKVMQAPAILRQRVVGQDRAINAIVDMLISANVGVSFTPSNNKAGKPKGVFFFVGPTGVGKTELAKALTELIFLDEHRMQRFDMSEYAEEHAAEKLTGSPPGYVGYEEGGQLTNYVRENPFSLLLFDEIEKADQKVMDKFLQILEDGRLTDSKGQTSYFAQTVLIFTSNIGSDSLSEAIATGNTEQGRQPGEMPSYEEIKSHYQQKVKEHFEKKMKRPEILNRFGDNILVFDILRPEYVRDICQKFLKILAQSAQDKKGITLHFDESIDDVLLSKVQEKDNLLFGGRRVRTLLEEMIEKPLNRKLFFTPQNHGTVLTLRLTKDGTLEGI